MAMQAMNMCKRSSFTEDELWSMVRTLKTSVLVTELWLFP